MVRNIINLQETSENNWTAKYQGNYGIYTIKINMAINNKMSSFICSCPSDYYPCKHISIIEKAILTKIEERKTSHKEKGISVEKILKTISHKELIDFTIQQTKYNPEFSNAILLKFAHKWNSNGENHYQNIICKALKKIHFDRDDLYDYLDDSFEIDVLNEWLEKAKEHLREHNYQAAIDIAKACLEEFAEWLTGQMSETHDYLDPSYHETTFEILEKAATSSDTLADELFHYCKEEMKKEKYKNTYFMDGFSHFMKEFAGSGNADEFMQIQDELLKSINHKSSYEAEVILDRKIDFYEKNNQPEKAWNIILENIQIAHFRKKVVKRKVEEQKWKEAKGLIFDYLEKNDSGYQNDWKLLLLEIAQKEENRTDIRKITFELIENNFQRAYYRMYKETYTEIEWEQELEKIIKHYSKKNKYFCPSVADVFVEEKATERLLKYIEKYLSLEKLARYYIYFYEIYPETTLAMFREAVDYYAERNTGRSHYEYIANRMKEMEQIQGGRVITEDMIKQYKIIYKNRKAMIEILSKM